MTFPFTTFLLLTGLKTQNETLLKSMPFIKKELNDYKTCKVQGCLAPPLQRHPQHAVQERGGKNKTQIKMNML